MNRLPVVLVLLTACGEPTGPTIDQQLTVGSYTLAYQDTGFNGQGVMSWYRGTMEVLSIASSESIVVSFDVVRDNSTQLHFQVDAVGYPFIALIVHERSSYFLAPQIRSNGCGELGCLFGQRIIALTTVPDAGGNFCAFGIDPGKILKGDLFPEATTCIIERLP